MRVVYKPKPGDFGLTQIQGHVGRAIRVGQWLNGDSFADYEHAFIYVGATAEGNIIEAEPGGARIGKLSDYTWHGYDVVWYPAPENNAANRIVHNALRLVGTPYSFADYAAIALHRFHVPTPHLKRYIAASGHMICSQLVDECYRRAGVHLFDDGRWSGDVTPGDLYSLIQSGAW